MPWAAAGAVVGGLVAADASKSAANKQEAGANAATATSQEQARITRNDNLPYMQRGNAAGNRLQYVMGTGGSGAPMTSAPTRDQFNTASDPITQAYREFLGRNPEAGGNAYYQSKLANGWSIEDIRNDIANSQEAGWYGGNVHYNPTAADTADGDQRYQQALTDYQASQANGGKGADGQYGSLMRGFSQDDLDNDVVNKNALTFALGPGQAGAGPASGRQRQLPVGRHPKGIGEVHHRPDDAIRQRCIQPLQRHQAAAVQHALRCLRYWSGGQ
jgi:hypothetical protein